MGLLGLGNSCHWDDRIELPMSAERLEPVVDKAAIVAAMVPDNPWRPSELLGSTVLALDIATNLTQGE